MNLMKMDEGWVWLVVFLLVFKLDYSDFKVKKMEDRLEDTLINRSGHHKDQSRISTPHSL
jgi:hypothetical protein